MSEGFMQVEPSYAPVPQAGEVKSPAAFRTISEVADGLALPQHVLRFWESKFQQIKPLKRGGGRRYYRPEDVKVIYEIKDLLYNQGFTIRGVQKLLRDRSSTSVARQMVAQPQVPASIASVAEAVARPSQPSQNHGLSTEKRRDLEGLLAELKSIRSVLKQTGI